MRFTEYVTRFVRLASRYEEEITGTTTFGYPSAPFTEVPGKTPRLGSGIAFTDEATCLKELIANAHRIEAWRKTNSYKYLTSVCRSSGIMGTVVIDFRIMRSSRPTVLSRGLMFFIKSFDCGIPRTCKTRKRLPSCGVWRMESRVMIRSSR